MIKKKYFSLSAVKPQAKENKKKFFLFKIDKRKILIYNNFINEEGVAVKKAYRLTKAPSLFIKPNS